MRYDFSRRMFGGAILATALPCAAFATEESPVIGFDPRRDLDDWAQARGLRPLWRIDDVSALARGGRAASVLSYIHEHPDLRLGNSIAFTEMLFGRHLRDDEIAGFQVRVTDFGVSPDGFVRLLKYLDGLFRIDDARFRERETDAAFDRYRARAMPFDRLSWFFGGPPLVDYGGMGARRRDWEQADYKFLPVQRYLAYLQVAPRLASSGLTVQHALSRMVFGRELDAADLVAHVSFVPRELDLTPDGFGELLEFIREQAWAGELRLEANWRDDFPEIAAFEAGSVSDGH